MGTHVSAVNFQNLIRDLAEMYPEHVAEVIVIELVANSLDAGASRIDIEYNPESRILAITDDGKGMTAKQFEEYHDFAAGLKIRGTGIGFAGVGAKISFNIADRVVTRTRGASFKSGSNWYLKSKSSLVWEDVSDVRLDRPGTRVEIHFRSDADLPYTTHLDLELLLRTHYLPFFDTTFLGLYEKMKLYSKSVRFSVNGHVIEPGSLSKDLGLDKVREFFPALGGKKYGYGMFGLAKMEYPAGGDLCGVLLCTYGKVIKADLFNQFPGSMGTRLFGIVEVPEFVKFLTTSKTDFSRKGKRKEFEKIYDPIRQEFKQWLKEIGVQSVEVVGGDEAAKLERDLKKLLEAVPELNEFLGTAFRKQVLNADPDGSVPGAPFEGTSITFPIGEGPGRKKVGPKDIGGEPGTALVESEKGQTPSQPIGRVAKRGPRVAFIEAPERTDLAWVEGNSILINAKHPCYIKTQTDQGSRRLHCLYAIASAIQRHIGSSSDVPDFLFVDRMMAAWASK